MNRRDRGDARDMRPHYRGKRRDLTFVVHADFIDPECGVFWHPRKRKRHAPMVVVRRSRSMHRPHMLEREPQGLFGRGLADGARDRGDTGGCAFPRRTAGAMERRENFIDDIKRPKVLERARMLLIDHSGGRALGKSGADKVVAIQFWPLDGKKKFSRAKRAGINGNAGDASARYSARNTCRK